MPVKFITPYAFCELFNNLGITEKFSLYSPLSITFNYDTSNGT